VLIAYQLVGPNQPRLIALMRKFPACTFSVLVDHRGVAESLSRVAAAANLTVPVWLDVDVGQHRTGIAPGAVAIDLYRTIAGSRNLRPAGLHVYDGHNHQENPADREAAVSTQFAAVRELQAELMRLNLPVPRIACGGTPTFPIYAKVPGVELSPGTCVLHDHGYGSRFPEMGFERAALLLTRVISQTAPDRMCLDLGYKAVASDPKGDRLVLLGLPAARLVLQNEEHLLVETPDAARYQPGDELLACPTHICPTCALHRSAYAVEHGRVVERWPVVARDRWLEI
jgi:D-serine deaminase-like pyridoxal phosphate-dependent protein